MRWMLVLCLVAGCAVPREPGRLPTDEELCAFQRGIFRAGVCHTTAGQ